MQIAVNNNSSAVIFDMDGVIVDTAEYHFKAWHDTLMQFGVDFKRGDFPRIFGRRDDAIVKLLLGNSRSSDEVMKISLEKEAYYRSILTGNIRSLPGAVTLIKSLKRGGFKLAVASSAVPENIEVVLESVGVRSDFDAVVNGFEVTESKPSPQIYLKAAEKVVVATDNAVVVEDAVIGVEGAKRGGIKAVAVTTSHRREEFAVVNPDIIVDSLEELSITDFEKLLSKNKTSKRSR
jgi:beta-phosphoglucomutase family hydrolase